MNELLKNNNGHLYKAKKKIDDLVFEHIETLARKRIQMCFKDSYGVVNTEKWDSELTYFWQKVIFPKLNLNDKQALSKIKFASIFISRWLDTPIQIKSEKIYKTIYKDVSIDQLSPVGYEQFCSSLLENIGFSCELTKATGDQGADIIAARGEVRYVFQCKKYGASVGNKAVQEVIAAKMHYQADVAAVVSNADYTKSARQLASTTGVLLLSHLDLPYLASDST